MYPNQTENNDILNKWVSQKLPGIDVVSLVMDYSGPGAPFIPINEGDIFISSCRFNAYYNNGNVIVVEPKKMFDFVQNYKPKYYCQPKLPSGVSKAIFIYDIQVDCPSAIVGHWHISFQEIRKQVNETIEA